jgi:hypothetical protein
MTDLNLDPDYFDHPKTLRLIGLLGKGAEVLPLKLWCICAKYHAEDGGLQSYSTQEIESLVRWWGRPGEAVEALARVGFIESGQDGFRVHSWTEHQGHIHALKVRNKKVARNRWKKLKSDAVTVDTSGIPKNTSGIPQPTILTDLPTVEAKPTPKPKERAGKFTPPSPPEATEYAKSIGFALDGEQFCAFYQAKGWVVGRSPMRDWRAAVRTWKIRDAKGGQNANGNSGKDKPIVGDAKPVPGKYAGIGRVVRSDGDRAQGVRLDHEPSVS